MPKQLEFRTRKDGTIEIVEGMEQPENPPVLEQGALFERDRYRIQPEPHQRQREMFGTGDNQGRGETMPHFEKRSNNSWTFRLELPRDPVIGRRKQRAVTMKGTRKDAERKYAEMLNSLSTGGYVEPNKLTVGAYLRQSIDDHAIKIRSRTEEEYRAIINTHLIPNLGGIPLAQLTAAHVQAYYTKALKSGARTGSPVDSPPGLSCTSTPSSTRR